MTRTCYTMNNTFPGFGYEVGELSAFLITLDIFIISLKNQDIIRHQPPDPFAFRDWLAHHNIRDVSDHASPAILRFYADTPPGSPPFKE